MEDNKIIELYFARDDTAISETKRKYGKLLYSISYNILNKKEKIQFESSLFYTRSILHSDSYFIFVRYFINPIRDLLHWRFAPMK